MPKLRNSFFPRKENNSGKWTLGPLSIDSKLSTQQDRKLISLFENEGDFHQLVADDLSQKLGVKFPRQQAKTVNYLMSYGGGKQVLAKALHTSVRQRSKSMPLIEIHILLSSRKLWRHNMRRNVTWKFRCGLAEFVTLSTQGSVIKLSMQLSRAEHLRLSNVPCSSCEHQDTPCQIKFMIVFGSTWTRRREVEEAQAYNGRMDKGLLWIDPSEQIGNDLDDSLYYRCCSYR